MIATYRDESGRTYRYECGERFSPRFLLVGGRLARWVGSRPSSGGGRRPAADPWVRHSSLALAAYHPDDQRFYEEDARRRGARISFNPDGTAHFNSKRELDRYCDAYPELGLRNFGDYR